MQTKIQFKTKNVEPKRQVTTKNVVPKIQQVPTKPQRSKEEIEQRRQEAILLRQSRERETQNQSIIVVESKKQVTTQNDVPKIQQVPAKPQRSKEEIEQMKQEAILLRQSRERETQSQSIIVVETVKVNEEIKRKRSPQSDIKPEKKRCVNNIPTTISVKKKTNVIPNSNVPDTKVNLRFVHPRRHNWKDNYPYEGNSVKVMADILRHRIVSLSSPESKNFDQAECEWDLVETIHLSEAENYQNHEQYYESHDDDDEDDKDWNENDDEEDEDEIIQSDDESDEDENDYNDDFLDDHGEKCVCTNEPIMWLSYIKNTKTNILTFVGSSCITKFFTINKKLVQDCNDSISVIKKAEKQLNNQKCLECKCVIGLETPPYGKLRHLVCELNFQEKERLKKIKV